jgi:hypothetical protein
MNGCKGILLSLAVGLFVCLAIVLTTVVWYAIPYLLPNDFSPAALEQSRKAGEPILAAIEAYRSIHGTHPVSLEEAQIDIKSFEPPVAGGRRWKYSGWRANEYYLSVPSRVSPGLEGGISFYSYSSRKKKWELVQTRPS